MRRQDLENALFDALSGMAARRAEILKDEAKIWNELANLLADLAKVPVLKESEPSERLPGSKVSTPEASEGRPTLSPSDAADYLGVSVQTLAKWRLAGGGPVFVKLGRRIVYRRNVLEAFLQERTHPHTSSYGMHDGRRGAKAR